MAETPDQDPRTEKDGPAEADKPSRRRLADLTNRLLTRKWLAIILGVSVVFHAVAFGYYKLRAGGSDRPAEGEVSLGEYQFVAPRPVLGQVAEASFSLHLALLAEVDTAARQRLEARTFRVQQEIEQFLRCAHSDDFDDPVLEELKRQLQEQINGTLGLRAIAEVIITDLQTHRLPEPSAPTAETAEAPPWADTPAG